MLYDEKVRTTFTPTPAVGDQIRRIAAQSGRSLSAVVNDLLAKALDQEGEVVTPRKRYRIEAFPMGLRPGIDPDRLSKDVQDMEDEEWLQNRMREEAEERARQALTHKESAA